MANRTPSEIFASGNDLLASAMYRENVECTKNNFVSTPLLVSANLALMCCGAKDDTAHEIKSVIKLPASFEEIQKLMKKIMGCLNGGRNHYIRAADRVFLHKSLAFKKDFNKYMRNFSIEIQHTDFSQPLHVVNDINKWISTHTDGNMTEFCRADDMLKKFKLILISGMCFKGFWLKARQRDSISKNEFYVSSAKKVVAEFMEKIGIFRYCESDSLQAKIIKISFDNKDFSIMFVLPFDKDGLSKVESNIEHVFTSFDFTEERVQVMLPKFRVESKMKQLKRTLQHMGMKIIFKEEADFNNLTAEKNTLFIDEVLQNVFVEFCEEDVTRSSSIRTTSSEKMFVYSNCKEFFADHPFIFFISVQSYVLAIGRITNPNEVYISFFIFLLLNELCFLN